MTEPQYIRGFVKAFRSAVVDVEIADTHGVPLTLVKSARDLWKEARKRAKQEQDEFLDYEAVWCVFDVDEHPYLPEALDMAHQNYIELAVSNPCFELWLLLHFRENPGAQNRHYIQSLLKGFVADFEKQVDFEAFRQGVEDAEGRAERLERGRAERGDQPHSNPTTGVYRLSRFIRTGEAGSLMEE